MELFPFLFRGMASVGGNVYGWGFLGRRIEASGFMGTDWKPRNRAVSVHQCGRTRLWLWLWWSLSGWIGSGSIPGSRIALGNHDHDEYRIGLGTGSRQADG